MKRIMDEQEVSKFIFNRNIDNDIIKGSMIDMAQESILYTYLGDFYTKMVENYDDYVEYIDIYLKPIVAWQVLYSNFDYISYSITDKGMIAMLAENLGSLLGREQKVDSKMEIKRNIYTLVKQVLRIFDYEKKSKNPLFLDFEMKELPSIIKYKAGEKKIKTPY